jgi:hypothetical protein
MRITLHQFEQIDSLRDAARRDADRRDHRTGAPIRPFLNEAQHQSRLFDALIGILGYQAANDIPSLEEYADTLITDCLIGKVAVLDGEAA